MGLTSEMVENYLKQVPSLREIDNHKVKDENDCKTGQTTITIELGTKWIAQILEKNKNHGKKLLTKGEKRALLNLSKALDALPSSIGIRALMSAVSGLDEIQSNLFDSVNQYLDSISDIKKHRLLLKAIVLVLRIIEYDLSKKSGPISVGRGFFSITILSNEKRIENHGLVTSLLKKIIAEHNDHHMPRHECQI